MNNELACPVCGCDMIVSVGGADAGAICLGRHCKLVIKKPLQFLTDGNERTAFIEMVMGLN